MLLLIKNPKIAYEFGKGTSKSSLSFEGTPENSLHISTGETLQAPVKITISSEPRESPYEIGSIFFSEKDGEDPASVNLWVHASREEIDAIYAKCKGAKYAYMDFLDHAFAIHDDDWSSEWDLERGNPVAITSFSVHATDHPYLSEYDELAPPPAPVPAPAPAPSPIVVVAPESKYIKLLFWAVAFLAIILLLKLH